MSGLCICDGSAVHLVIEHASSYVINQLSAYGRTATWVLFLLGLLFTSWEKYLVLEGCDVMTVEMCGGCWSCTTKWLSTVCIPPPPPSVTIFDDRYFQMSFDCMDGNSTSSYGNEIKGEAVVMDRLISWFGGNTEKWETAPLAVITPFSSLSLCLSLFLFLCLHLILNVSLDISLLNSHLSVRRLRHRGGAHRHVLSKREPPLGNQ